MQYRNLVMQHSNDVQLGSKHGLTQPCNRKARQDRDNGSWLINSRGAPCARLWPSAFGCTCPNLDRPHYTEVVVHFREFLHFEHTGFSTRPSDLHHTPHSKWICTYQLLRLCLFRCHLAARFILSTLVTSIALVALCLEAIAGLQKRPEFVVILTCLQPAELLIREAILKLKRDDLYFDLLILLIAK